MDLVTRLSGKPATSPVTLVNEPAPQAGQKVNGTSGSRLGAFGSLCDRKDGIYHSGKEEVIMVVDGIKLEMPPFEPSDFYKVEKYLRDNRKTAVQALTDALEEIKAAPPEIREALLDRAYADMRRSAKVDDVSREDVARWLDTRAGAIYSMWIQMSKRHVGITEEDCEYILTRLSMEQVMEARDSSMSKDLVAFSEAKRR